MFLPYNASISRALSGLVDSAYAAISIMPVPKRSFAGSTSFPVCSATMPPMAYIIPRPMGGHHRRRRGVADPHGKKRADKPICYEYACCAVTHEFKRHYGVGEAFIQSVDGHGLRQDKASQKQVDDMVGTLTCHGNFSDRACMDSLPVL